MPIGCRAEMGHPIAHCSAMPCLRAAVPANLSAMRPTRFVINLKTAEQAPLYGATVIVRRGDAVVIRQTIPFAALHA